METVKYPSDFILKISSIKNKEGEELDLDTDKINISFTFKGDGPELYEAFYGGIDGENKNCYTEYIDVDDGGDQVRKKVLFVKFENYNIFGGPGHVQESLKSIDRSVQPVKFAAFFENLIHTFKPFP